MRRVAAVGVALLSLAPAAACERPAAPAESAFHYHRLDPGEARARELAGLLHAKFAYVGQAGGAGYLYEVSGPGISDLVAIRFDSSGAVAGFAFDAGPISRGGPATLLTTG